MGWWTGSRTHWGAGWGRRRPVGGGPRDDVVVALVAVHRGTHPGAVGEVPHAVDAIGQVRDGDRWPVRLRALDGPDLDVARIVRRGDELPADLAVIPGIGVHGANRLAAQLEQVE